MMYIFYGMYCILAFRLMSILHKLLNKAYLDGLMQKRCNSIADALELHLFCIKPSILSYESISVWKKFKIH